MNPGLLTRRYHPQVARLRNAREGRLPNEVFVEGLKTVSELLSSSWRIHGLYLTPSRRDRPETASLQAEAARRKLPIAFLSDDVMAFVSDLSSPPGIIALAERPVPPSDADDGQGVALVLGPLQSPANAGALLRVAEAAGVKDVWPIVGGVDLYGPKSLRAAAGSAFRLRLHSPAGWEERLDALRAAGRRLAAADARGSVAHDRWDWRPPTALILGAETGGLPTDLLAQKNVQALRIPMAPPVDSLNVAVAAGLLLYEARRAATPHR